MAKDGIALYIYDNFTFIVRSDLSINIEGEFESIIIEVKNIASKIIIIGEIYREQNTSICDSIARLVDFNIAQNHSSNP